jgi:hypothetical protein
MMCSPGREEEQDGGREGGHLETLQGAAAAWEEQAEEPEQAGEGATWVHPDRPAGLVAAGEGRKDLPSHPQTFDAREQVRGDAGVRRGWRNEGEPSPANGRIWAASRDVPLRKKGR